MSGKPLQAKQPAEKRPLEESQAASNTPQSTSKKGPSAKADLHKPLGFLLSVCCALAAVGYVAWQGKPAYDEKYNQLPPSILEHFAKYDKNGDAFIDPYEFATLLNSGEVKKPSPSPATLIPTSEFIFIDPDQSFEKEVVIVMADFKPIVLESMMKFRQPPSVDGNPEITVPGLVKWKTPSRLLQSFGTRNFKFFMPRDLSHPIGDVYTILPPLSMESPGVNMYRYRPLQPSREEAFLFALLSQFHPYVFLQSRYGPRGGIAVVRARNDRYLDIMMRIHAEYQLNDEPNRQFWFTPAQYTGRLIIDREAQHVEFFELYLPTNKQLNIDMEWITPEGSHSVDIGFVPEMRLRSLNPSAVLQNNSEVVMNSGNYNFNAIKWDEEISLDRALVLLEQGFYPFKKIPYLYFTNAMDLARQQEKLVHFILLWGALDDQSCCGSGRTLRDGPLGCSPVTTVLDSSYISSWALVNDIEDLIKNTSATEEHRKFGRLAMEAYKFPVESMVIRPTDGTVVHKVNINDLLHINSPPPPSTGNSQVTPGKSHMEEDTVDIKSLYKVVLQSLCDQYLAFLEEGKSKALEV